MGIISSLLSATPTGKVGAWVFRRVKGQTIASAYQPNVSVPRSDGQKFTWKKMSLLVALYRKAATFFNTGFMQTPDPRSPYNGFIVANNPEALTGLTEASAAIDFSLIKGAKGTVGVVPIVLDAIGVGTGNAEFSWNPATIPAGGAASDNLCILLYNENLQEAATYMGAADRSIGSSTFAFPTNWGQAEVVHAYAYFRNIADNTVSDSYYMTDSISA